MKRAQIQAELDALATAPGVLACALVDTAAGMIYAMAGAQHELIEAQLEAASDYWRLSMRTSRTYRQLGDLQALNVVRAGGVINLLPCADDIIFITIAQRRGVDWPRWPARAAALVQLVRANTLATATATAA